MSNDEQNASKQTAPADLSTETVESLMRGHGLTREEAEDLLSYQMDLGDCIDLEHGTVESLMREHGFTREYAESLLAFKGDLFDIRAEPEPG